MKCWKGVAPKPEGMSKKKSKGTKSNDIAPLRLLCVEARAWPDVFSGSDMMSCLLLFQAHSEADQTEGIESLHAKAAKTDRERSRSAHK